VLAGIDRPLGYHGTALASPRSPTTPRRWPGCAAAPLRLLRHDRDSPTVIDDSSVRFASVGLRLLRRARGVPPIAIALPPGFEAAPRCRFSAASSSRCSPDPRRRGDPVAAPAPRDADTFDDYRIPRAVTRRCTSIAPGARGRPPPEYLIDPARPRRARGRRPALVRGGQTTTSHIATACGTAFPRDAPPCRIALDCLGLGETARCGAAHFLIAITALPRSGGFPRIARAGAYRRSA